MYIWPVLTQAITIRSICNLKHFRNLLNQTQQASKFIILQWEPYPIMWRKQFCDTSIEICREYKYVFHS